MACLEGGKLDKYNGETHKCVRERAREHLREARLGYDKSHMLNHILDCHPGSNAKYIFKINVINTHQAALSRGVEEAILIATADCTLLNSKHEYVQTMLPKVITNYEAKIMWLEEQEGKRKLRMNNQSQEKEKRNIKK